MKGNTRSSNKVEFLHRYIPGSFSTFRIAIFIDVSGKIHPFKDGKKEKVKYLDNLLFIICRNFLTLVIEKSILIPLGQTSMEWNETFSSEKIPEILIFKSLRNKTSTQKRTSYKVYNVLRMLNPPPSPCTLVVSCS